MTAPVNLVYTHDIRIEKQNIDALNHVNNVVYVQWVQDTAAAHWLSTASPGEKQQYRWVVLRHEIDYLKPAFMGDELKGYTWVEKMSGVKSFRHVEIRRGTEVLVKALTTWVMLSAENSRPARIPVEMAARYLPRP